MPPFESLYVGFPLIADFKMPVIRIRSRDILFREYIDFKVWLKYTGELSNFPFQNIAIYFSSFHLFLWHYYAGISH